MAAIWWFVRHMRLVEPAVLLHLGLVLALLTVGFEFLFGRYVAGHTWTTLLADYNLLRGRLWPLVLLTLLLGPLLVARLE